MWSRNWLPFRGTWGHSRVCNKSNTTGTTCGAETDNPSEAPELIPGFVTYKPGDELRFLWRVISFCSTCDTRGVTLVTNPGMNSGASEGQSVSAPHVVPVVLLLLQTRGLTQVPLKVYQFLLHMWYPSCYSCYKPGNDLMCLWRVISFCSTCGTLSFLLLLQDKVSFCPLQGK
jgi:hypothetical protein